MKTLPFIIHNNESVWSTEKPIIKTFSPFVCIRNKTKQHCRKIPWRTISFTVKSFLVFITLENNEKTRNNVSVSILFLRGNIAPTWRWRVNTHPTRRLYTNLSLSGFSNRKWQAISVLFNNKVSIMTNRDQLMFPNSIPFPFHHKTHMFYNLIETLLELKGHPSNKLCLFGNKTVRQGHEKDELIAGCFPPSRSYHLMLGVAIRLVTNKGIHTMYIWMVFKFIVD